MREFAKIYAGMEEINENKNYFRDFEILSQSFKLIGNEIKEKLKTERGVRLIFIPEWKEFSDAQRELFLDIVVSPIFISKIDDKEVKSAIISCLENLPQKYGGEKIHGGENSLKDAINTVAVNLSQYLRKNLEKEHIKKYRETVKNLRGKEQIRTEWQIFLLGCLNFWDFNDFKNFEKEIEKFRKRNRIDIGRFKEEREKIWQIFVEHLSDEYAKKINEEVEWLKNAVDLLDSYIKGEIDESRLFPIINLDYWRRYMIENILEIDKNDTDLIKQKENEITEIFRKEVKEKIKPDYEKRVKVLSKKEFVRDEIIRNLYSSGYQQIKYWRLEDLIRLAKVEKLEVYTNANFVFFDENDLKIKYGVGATSTHPIEDLFVLVLIKKENKLYSFKKLKEKIEKHPKLKRIPEYFQCLLKDYIFYGDFNEKDWDLIHAYRSKNANKDLRSIKNIFREVKKRRKERIFDDYTTPNRFLRRATAFYIMEGILIEKVKIALEDKNVSPFLKHILEEKLGEDIEKLNEYLRRQKSKKTKSYWNLINSIMIKLGYLPIGRKEYFDFERIMKIF